jgi:hypothetical protein
MDEYEWSASENGMNDSIRSGEKRKITLKTQIKLEPLEDEVNFPIAPRKPSARKSSLTGHIKHTTMGSSSIPHASGTSDIRPIASNPGPLVRTMVDGLLFRSGFKDEVLVANSDSTRSQPSQRSGPSQPSQPAQQLIATAKALDDKGKNAAFPFLTYSLTLGCSCPN